ncbi:hypothetical protein ACIPVB_08990 [Microbacterium sp. NPDC090007]|uniref:hypothetical protein n=1 Tax=Microbacterium sp. NPDC090007 TaxID=3364204 RepID=UPI0038213BAB
MPRAKAPCGTYTAYKRHLRDGEDVDSACRRAQKEHDAARSTSVGARRARAVAEPVDSAPELPLPPPAPMPTTDEGHVSRLEVLKELLEQQRELLPALRRTDPGRAYLLMREQRETVREIAEIQGNGQAKGVTLADQLAEARAARTARAAGA